MANRSKLWTEPIDLIGEQDTDDDRKKWKNIDVGFGKKSELFTKNLPIDPHQDFSPKKVSHTQVDSPTFLWQVMSHEPLAIKCSLLSSQEL